MRIHYLQHVPFEGLSSIGPALLAKGHHLSFSRLYENHAFPPISDIDWLIVLGGPMGIYDEDIYPWLTDEKSFLQEVIKAGKIVIGICLGAQLIADALGVKVYKNKHKEIGWFDITPSPELANTILADVLPKHTAAFHWHGDTFEIPIGAQALASSKACKNQGFILNDRVVALQFHLEATLESAKALIENCRTELDNSEYVQSESEMLADQGKFTNINQLMLTLLNRLAKIQE